MMWLSWMATIHHFLSLAHLRHLVGYSVKTKSCFFTTVWHANPHLASFPCGGLSASVPGLNASDAASYSNSPYPHPPLSENLLPSFTMKSTSCRVPATSG